MTSKTVRMMGPMGTGPRIRTTDSIYTTHELIDKRVRTHDALLTPPTPPEMAEWSRRMATMSGCDLGRLSVGDLTAKLDAVRAADPSKFTDALKTIADALADYGHDDLASGTASSGPAGSLAFNGGLSKAATADSSGGAQLRRWRDQTGSEVASINAMNAAFWEKQTAHQKR